MDSTDLTKHLPEVVSVAKVAAASIPFTAVVKRMLGPAADELAEMWRDQVRLYRYERQTKCVKKAEQMLLDAGITPSVVSPKILFPLLEGASFEDNEDLHTMWAALLANAASPESAKTVRPGFIAILRQMAPDEAALLNRLKDRNRKLPRPTFIRIDAGFDVQACLDGLQAECLIRNDAVNLDDEVYFTTECRMYALTARGNEFVAACRPPKPKS